MTPCCRAEVPEDQRVTEELGPKPGCPRPTSVLFSHVLFRTGPQVGSGICATTLQHPSLCTRASLRSIKFCFGRLKCILLSTGVTVILLGHMTVMGLPSLSGVMEGVRLPARLCLGTLSPVGGGGVCSGPTMERQPGLRKMRSVPSKVLPFSGGSFPCSSPVLPVSVVPGF